MDKKVKNLTARVKRSEVIKYSKGAFSNSFLKFYLESPDRVEIEIKCRHGVLKNGVGKNHLVNIKYEGDLLGGSYKVLSIESTGIPDGFSYVEIAKKLAKDVDNKDFHKVLGAALSNINPSEEHQAEPVISWIRWQADICAQKANSALMEKDMDTSMKWREATSLLYTLIRKITKA